MRLTKFHNLLQHENILHWNQSYAIGTPVLYREVVGASRPKPARTLSAAFMADCGVAVIQLEGVSGYVALSHVQAA